MLALGQKGAEMADITVKKAIANGKDFLIGEVEVCFGTAAAQSYNFQLTSLGTGLVPHKKILKRAIQMYVPASGGFQGFSFKEIMQAYDPEGFQAWSANF